MKVGDRIILVGTQILNKQTGEPVIRQDNQIYITSGRSGISFPNSQFTEDPSSVLPTPTPAGFDFSVPTRTLPTPSQPTIVPQQPLLFEDEGPVVVILDPGKDPVNFGTLAPNGMREADLTYSICQKVSEILNRNQNYKVLLTWTAGVGCSVRRTTHGIRQ